MIDFFGGLAKVIGRSRLVGICSLVRLQDLEKFNTERGLQLEPYPLAAYGCMLLTARDNLPGISIELVFDNVEKVQSKLAKANEYAASDTYYDGSLERVVTSGLPKNLTAKDVPAMQAADFFAWEFRKSHEKVADWFDLTDRPRDRDAGWEHMQEWSQQQFGSKIPPPRGSATALLDGNEFYPLIWDYQTLCEAHEARGGVWA